MILLTWRCLSRQREPTNDDAHHRVSPAGMARTILCMPPGVLASCSTDPRSHGPPFLSDPAAFSTSEVHKSSSRVRQHGAPAVQVAFGDGVLPSAGAARSRGLGYFRPCCADAGTHDSASSGPAIRRGRARKPASTATATATAATTGTPLSTSAATLRDLRGFHLDEVLTCESTFVVALGRFDWCARAPVARAATVMCLGGLTA